MAIEGCHRLTAAAELGIKPDFVVFDPNDLIEVDSSLEGDYFRLGETHPGHAFVAAYRGCSNPRLTINLNGTLTVVPKKIRDVE
jgi:hypothetical protein